MRPSPNYLVHLFRRREETADKPKHGGADASVLCIIYYILAVRQTQPRGTKRLQPLYLADILRF